MKIIIIIKPLLTCYCFIIEDAFESNEPVVKASWEDEEDSSAVVKASWEDEEEEIIAKVSTSNASATGASVSGKKKRSVAQAAKDRQLSQEQASF